MAYPQSPPKCKFGVNFGWAWPFPTLLTITEFRCCINKEKYSWLVRLPIYMRELLSPINTKMVFGVNIGPCKAYGLMQGMPLSHTTSILKCRWWCVNQPVLEGLAQEALSKKVIPFCAVHSAHIAQWPGLYHDLVIQYCAWWHCWNLSWTPFFFIQTPSCGYLSSH